MMAKKEWTPENWKWDEEKIRKYMAEFEKFLNSEEGKSDLEIRREKLLMAQKFLKDEESIDKLSSEDLKELLKIVDTLKAVELNLNRVVSIIEKDKNYKEQIKNWLKNLIKIQEGDQLPKGPEYFTVKSASELLTFRYPEKFYIVNGASIDQGIKELGSGSEELPSADEIDEMSYFNLRPLFGELKEKIKPVIEKNLNKQIDYYDVDQFLYFVKSKKEEVNKKEEELKIKETPSRSEENHLTLQEFLKLKGFYFDEPVITAFYSALKTKGFVILSGLSGTGKTKLAQVFAELFEMEKIKVKSDKNYSSFTVQIYPYMLQYTRIYIRKPYVELLNLVDIEKEKYVKVIAGNEEETCKIVKYPPYALLLKGKVAKWFKENFKEGDKLLIGIQPTEDSEDMILILKKFEIDKAEIVKEKRPAYLFLSVRPDWRDGKALLGYYNPLTENYERTSLIDFIKECSEDYQMNKEKANPYFIILDEMNLSHVEYYFADFLSVLESGRDKEKNYLTKESIKLHDKSSILDNDDQEIPKEIYLPPNLYIIGSVNIDETTYMFSPKVLDRAFTIEFREIDFDSYNPFEIDEKKAKPIVDSIRNSLLEDLRNKKNDQARFCGAVADKEEIKEALNWIKENKVRNGNLIFDELKELNQILQPYDLHFGYRVLDEIALFIKYAMTSPAEVGKLDEEQALDFAVLMKVLPKFHGPRQKLERPLWLVLNWCLVNPVEFDNKKSENLIKEIWKKLKENWKELKGKESPSIDDIFFVIQELRLELKNIKKESQVTNTELQTINQQEKQTTEENEQAENVAQQAEQTNATSKGSFKYPRTAIKVLSMLRQLYETGFASFA
jgi:5-methylcytosine-specific restriction endonuclease McrBC GTP-binding regulatory subunit McrB